MLAKKELFQIPLWGRGLRAAEFVEVDRANHRRAIDSIDHAAQLVRDGVSIYLAPEGTRSMDGRIGKLKKGGFHLALATGAPIVPVAIRGTINILPRGSRAMRTGQHVSVVIGPPIEVAGCDIGNLMSQVAQFLVKNVENDAVHPRS
jgi:1-acyl-sn-glycerol-3-phosphate acyltransferase